MVDGEDAPLLAKIDFEAAQGDRLKVDTFALSSEHSRLLDEIYALPRPSCCGIPKYVVSSVLLTTLVSILLGYDIGIWSTAKIKVQTHFELSDDQTSLLVGILNIMAAFGGLCSSVSSDRFGRKFAIGMACFLFFVGSLIKSLANGFIMLLVGRVISGVGVGVGLSIAPVYSAEIAPKRSRGALVSFTEIALNVGILVGYGVGFWLNDLSLDVGWRIMLAVGMVPAMFIIVALFFMPESPRWLIAKGRDKDALTCLAKAMDRDEAEMIFSSVSSQKIETASFLDMVRIITPVFGPSHFPPERVSFFKRALVAGLGTAFLQQATGVEAQVYYTPEILRDAGMTSENNILGGQCLVGAVKVMAIIIATVTLDRDHKWFGRVPLLIISALGMCIGQSILGVNFQIGGNVPLALFGQCFFMTFFSIGYGPVAWIYASEIFPLEIRGICVGAACFVNRYQDKFSVLFGYLSCTVPCSRNIFIPLSFVLYLFLKKYLTHGLD